MNADQGRCSLDALADADEHENQQAAVRHICIACGVRTNAVGTALYLRADRGAVHPFETTGFCGEEIAELQTLLGEGPASTAARQNWPVLVPDLADPVNTERWPLFSPAAVAAGVAAVFTFPLTLGSQSLGVLELHRDTCGALLPDEITDVVQLADAAMALLLDQSAQGADGNPAEEQDGEPHSGVLRDAIGVVATQLNVGNGEAFVRLRVRSGLTGHHLFRVASDVVERGVLFTNSER